MEWYPVDAFNIKRKYKHTTVHAFGKSLLDLCCEFGIHVLNGRCEGDECGEMTFVSQQGSSIVDYILVDTNLFCKLQIFQVLNTDLSMHFPIVTELSIDTLTGNQHNILNVNQNQPLLTQPVKYRWREESRDHFLQMLTDEHSQSQLSALITEGMCDVNRAADILVAIFQRATENMKVRGMGKLKHINTQPNSVWWDVECDHLKVLKNRYLNMLRCSNSKADLKQYIDAKAAFRKVCKTKKLIAKENLRSNLLENINDTKKFWKTIKSMGTKKAPCPYISPDKWVQHFKTVLNQEVDIEEEFANGATQYNTEHDAQCEDCETNNVLWLND